MAKKLVQIIFSFNFHFNGVKQHLDALVRNHEVVKRRDFDKPFESNVAVDFFDEGSYDKTASLTDFWWNVNVTGDYVNNLEEGKRKVSNFHLWAKFEFMAFKNVASRIKLKNDQVSQISNS